jgi:hypothetical protein
MGWRLAISELRGPKISLSARGGLVDLVGLGLGLMDGAASGASGWQGWCSRVIDRIVANHSAEASDTSETGTADGGIHRLVWAMGQAMGRAMGGGEQNWIYIGDGVWIAAGLQSSITYHGS